ncbi:MAG: hypothetical protein LBD89_05090 [Tannerellaceae bacterium]|jgi:hypothetical protein|nr:hypothetical protein [Tannerellaceae bacterium]
MNQTNALIILVKSLTKAEKRYFRLQTNLQSGEKVYLALFDLLDADRSPEDAYAQFEKDQGGRCVEMATKHLYRNLLDCLVRLREKQDMQTEICNRIAKAGILFERGLAEDSLEQLSKAKQLATDFEYDLLLQLIRRTELKYLSACNFKGVSERELVGKQMKINEIMRHSRSINQHLQLYDILKHRLIYKGYARSDKQKEDLNDLLLSELHLIANTSYRGFEAQKLHLLFQATYDLNSGNYKLAIRYYQELISLFEENRHLLLNPPVYYLSAIKGILDSLQNAGLYKDMLFFLSKLSEIARGDYPTEFTLSVRTQLYLYESSCLIHTGDFEKAQHLMHEAGEGVFKKMPLLGLEDQLKLHLSSAILYISQGEYVSARKWMRNIFGSGKLFHVFPSYKTARLVNLILQAELGNYDFFENEIHAIKRNIHYEKQVYATEKLLFKFIHAYPLPSYEKSRRKLWNQFHKDFAPIQQSKYEGRLLRIFDFLAWIEYKLTRRPLAEILQEKNSR